MPITQFGSAMGLSVVRSGVQIWLLQRSEIRVLILPSTPTPALSSIIKGYYKQSIVLHSLILHNLWRNKYLRHFTLIMGKGTAYGEH